MKLRHFITPFMPLMSIVIPQECQSALNFDLNGEIVYLPYHQTQNLADDKASFGEIQRAFYYAEWPHGWPHN